SSPPILRFAGGRRKPRGRDLEAEPLVRVAKRPLHELGGLASREKKTPIAGAFGERDHLLPDGNRGPYLADSQNRQGARPPRDPAQRATLGDRNQHRARGLPLALDTAHAAAQGMGQEQLPQGHSVAEAKRAGAEAPDGARRDLDEPRLSALRETQLRVDGAV